MKQKFLIFCQIVTLFFLYLPAIESSCSPSGCHCSQYAVSCNNSHLHTLPPTISSTTKELHLANNSIKSLQNNSFHNTLELTTLDLQHNEISKIATNAFKGLTKLSGLYLNHNNLTNINSFLVQDLAKLQIANFSFNNISVITQHALDHLKSLQVLDLSRNHITRVHPHAFTMLTKLKSLYLSHNNLSVAYPAWFSASSLKNVSMNNNSWTCDCKMKTYYVWFKSSSSQGHVHSSLNLDCRKAQKKLKSFHASNFTKCHVDGKNCNTTSSCSSGTVQPHPTPPSNGKHGHPKIPPQHHSTPINLPTPPHLIKAPNPTILHPGHQQHPMPSPLLNVFAETDVTALNAGKHCCFSNTSLLKKPKKCFFVTVKPPVKRTGHLPGVVVALIVIGILILLVGIIVFTGKKLQAKRRKNYGLLNEPSVFEPVHDVNPQVSYSATTQDVSENEV